MRLLLPHLPNKLDVLAASYLRNIVIVPPHCKLAHLTVKYISAEAMKAESKEKSVDMSTIFGVVRSKKVQLVQEFVNEKGQDAILENDAEGFTVLHWAVYEGDTETVNYLIELGAPINNYEVNGPHQSPLHWACVKGRTEMIRILLDKDVNINLKDNKGYSPLITACQYGHTALVAYLVSRGAKLEIEDKNGDNALHWAVYKGHPELTRLLIVYGLNPKKIDNYGQSILHLAALNGNLNIVQHLIEQDCIDTEIKDNNGKKAIDLARIRAHSEVVDFIDRHSRNRKSAKFHFKACLFGPVGNSRGVFIAIHVLILFYKYPAYFLQGLSETWEDHMWLNIWAFIISIIMWISLWKVHLADPGYLKLDTVEYQNALRRLTFRAASFSPADWNKNLSRLCHTCKTVKPYRASHCKACNRCVLAYDHHCPYVQNCVGYKNRPYFFLYVLSTVILMLISLRFAWICMYKDPYQWWYYPGILCLFFFCVMTTILLFAATCSAIENLTGNELSKQNKYDYLKDSKGQKKNIFSKGKLYNIKYYFHLVEPHYLETPEFDSHPNYNV